MEKNVNTRVVVIEDDRSYRESLVTLMSHTPGYACTATYETASAAIHEAKELHRRQSSCPWSLVLMDLEMPGINGIEGTRQLKTLWPELPIVILTVFEDPGTILEAICAGANGYILKNASAKELRMHLRAVLAGGSPLTPGVARAVLDIVRKSKPSRKTPAEPSRLDLTCREQEVLRGLVRGLSYRDVATELAISVDTVRTHIRNLYRKLQVKSAAQAVSRAIREHLI